MSTDGGYVSKLAGMSIEVQIRTGGDMDEHPVKRYFSLENAPLSMIRCPKAGCKGGGWDIGETLREMVSKKETSRKTGGQCRGNQRMGRMSRECLTKFEADIHLTYKA